MDIVRTIRVPASGKGARDALTLCFDGEGTAWVREKVHFYLDFASVEQAQRQISESAEGMQDAQVRVQTFVSDTDDQGNALSTETESWVEGWIPATLRQATRALDFERSQREQ